ncbi:MAG: signal recognition particle receptor subunit alpha [Candidatus Marsarchaeota archaeon]|nr:signal recognition particle receptor subunit alpha [Candidatus Marsarchaeota archaeon]
MDFGEGLRSAIARLRHATIIDSKTIKEFNKELQKTLLGADVEVKLVSEISKRIEEKALKSNPPPGVTHKEYIVDIVYKELVALMGESFSPQVKGKRILLLGLYGSGKTTTAAKLAKFYRDRGISAGVICCDVSRPAAYEQLETLSKAANVAFFGMKGEKSPGRIVEGGLKAMADVDVVICDTSGRSGLDKALMEELKAVDSAFKADEKILVISSDLGQVAGRQAREFDREIGLSGVIVTKMDGSAKGGGALSAANAAHSRVMFIGTGETLGAIEPFSPAKFIGGLLGIPDIESLIGRVTAAIAEAGMDKEEISSEELNMETFYAQLKAMGKMGPLKNMLGMLGAADVSSDVIEKGEGRMKKFKVIISSMTNEERKNERLLHEKGRIPRIAKGSGTSERDVQELISEFNKMKKMFNTFKNDRNFKKRFSQFKA